MVEKPWGYYKDLIRFPDLVIKEIVIYSGQSISKQYHEKRTEVWMACIGVVTVTINDKVIQLKPCAKTDFEVKLEDNPVESSALLVSTGDTHRAENRTGKPVSFWEVQYGECSEEDIVRLEDKYDRN